MQPKIKKVLSGPIVSATSVPIMNDIVEDNPKIGSKNDQTRPLNFCLTFKWNIDNQNIFPAVSSMPMQKQTNKQKG